MNLYMILKTKFLKNEYLIKMNTIYIYLLTSLNCLAQSDFDKVLIRQRGFTHERSELTK